MFSLGVFKAFSISREWLKQRILRGFARLSDGYEQADALRQIAQRFEAFAQAVERGDVGVELSINVRLRTTPGGPVAGRPMPDTEAAERLGVAPELVRGFIRCGALDGYVSGRRYHVHPRGLDKLRRRLADPAQPRPDPLLTVTEAAGYFGVDRREIFNLRRRGAIRSEQRAAGVLVSFGELLRVLRQEGSDGR